MATEDCNAEQRTLGDYTIPSTASCGSSIVRPNVEANNFELKLSLIQLLQQEQFFGNSQEDPDGRTAAAPATGTKPILSNGRMGGTNPVPNVLCIDNNVEPRSQQNSSKSRVTGKNSPW
ncbi:hypothetical protein PIB30_083196 [Stylosanthes scabra]|uniref:Uncharacterized protein n=1 Tax=Stylosanthes scabra TaxID=79078 RepID=A0ABU6ZQW8_9FABA|nr:hypothetical protein [Stylosanthes scabra]